MAKRFYNEKVNRLDKLTALEKKDLLFDLLYAFQLIRSPEEVALFVQDLFTKTEVQFLSKRLRIAKLLLQDTTYEQIGKELHASHGTVAKVASWLSERGDGFRRVISQLPKSPEVDNSRTFSDWEKLMRRYPRYFWPQLLFAELARNHDKHQKEMIQKLLDNLTDKHNRDEERKELISDFYRTKPKK